MYLGRIVEIGTVEQIFADPKHPYTQALIRAIPEPDPDKRPARPAARRDPRRGRAAAGLLVPPALPEGVRDLRLGEPRPAHPPRGALDQAAEEDYEAERALVGDLDQLDEPALETVLPVADGRDAEEAIRMLDPMRVAAPDDPFWSGVAETTLDDRGVRVHFNPPLVPRGIELDGTRVECHLHDPEALAAAEAARAPGH